MQVACGNCRRPLKDPHGRCYSCSATVQDAPVQSTPTPRPEANPEAPSSITAGVIGMVGLLFICEGVAPSWAAKVYVRVGPILGANSLEQASAVILSVTSILAAITFGIWLHDRWSMVRAENPPRIPAWFAVLLCVVPVVAIFATIYLVSTVRNHFSRIESAFLVKNIGIATWIWWISYVVAGFIGSIHAANGSGWEAMCIFFGIACLAFAYIAGDLAGSEHAVAR